MNYFRCGGGRSTHTATKIDVAKTPLATFESNVSGLYLPEILAYIQASQSGTGDPSPSNPRAISGVSEVTTACNAINQWDEQWELGSINNSDGTNVTSSVRIRSKNYIEVKPNTSICVVNTNAVKIFIYKYGKDKSFLGMVDTVGISSGSQVVNIPSDCYYLRFRSNDNYTYSNNISFNYPATDTAYHAYTGQTATINLGGTYYGGYLNVTTGALVITCGMIKLSDIPKTKYGTYEAGARFITTFFDTISNTKLMGNSLLLNAIGKTLQTPYPTSGSWLHFSTGSSKTSFLIDQTDVGEGVQLNVSSVNSWFDSINAYAVYELATPQTYQLTPTQITQLLGQNNVFCSTGDVAVKYWKID